MVSFIEDAPTVQTLGSEAGEEYLASTPSFPAATAKKRPDATPAATWTRVSRASDAFLGIWREDTHGLVCRHILAATQAHVDDGTSRAVARCCIFDYEVDAGDDAGCRA